MPAVGPDEPYYCHEQIQIPPSLPDILKQFTKAAIRTQPKDVLEWSAAYFHALANNEPPPIKERLEMPVATQKTDTGLTPGILRMLNTQLGPKKIVPLQQIEQKWKAVALPIEQFQELVRIGGFAGSIEWMKFFALAASALGQVHWIWNICDALKTCCEILTHDPEGGAARIPMETFTEIYKYLAKIDGEIRQDTINMALSYLQLETSKQGGYIQPRIFLNPHCPRLY